MITKNALVIGYFGRWNVGDDLMAREAAMLLNNLGYNVRILTGDNYLNEVIGNLGGAQDCVRSTGVNILASLAWCDEVVLAGGTIYHDSFCDQEFSYYLKKLKKLTLFLKLARFLGKSVRFVGVGIGPLKRHSARQVARSALLTTKSIYVRDKASRNEVISLLGEDAPKVIVGPDLVFLGSYRLNALSIKSPIENRLGLSLLSMDTFLATKVGLDFWKPLADSISERMMADLELHLSVFAFWTAPDRAEDATVAQMFIALLPVGLKDRIEIVSYSGDPDVLIARMANCRAIIATRYHAAILAAILGRPWAIVEYNRKVRDFADAAQLPISHRLPGDRIISKYHADYILEILLNIPIEESNNRHFNAHADSARASLRRCLEIE